MHDQTDVVMEWLRGNLMPRNHGLVTIVPMVNLDTNGPLPRLAWRGVKHELALHHFQVYFGTTPFLMIGLAGDMVVLTAIYPCHISRVIRPLPRRPKARNLALKLLTSASVVLGDRNVFPEIINIDLNEPDSIYRLDSYINTIINAVKGAFENGKRGIVMREGIELTSLAELAILEYNSHKNRR